MLLAPALARAQPGTITGKIANTDGKPLSYANVMLVGTTWGGVAAADGTYKITVPAGRYDLKVTM
ncbi:MAG TPA: carboxypeptidase regulatory-like domain-containing protein, partial [Candidatus Krumholzibacteria bacterium]|nr:carboxypeptidase regulatory-like domain-containing protein [Candidatus Krumholzibacteria bacterium]